MIRSVDSYSTLLTSTPTIGAAVGVISGIAARLWNNIPAHVKFTPTAVVPFFPTVNTGMQVAFKGPLKYLIAFAPFAKSVAEACYDAYQSSSMTPLEQEFSKYEAVFSIALLTSSVFLACYWGTTVGCIGLGLEISEHVLVVLGFNNIITCGLSNCIENTDSYERTAVELLSCAYGLASMAFLFNTVWAYHTLTETVLGTALAVGLIATSHFIAKHCSTSNSATG